MNTTTKVAAFAAGLGGVFLIALGFGAYVGPVGEPAAAHDDAHSDSGAQNVAQEPPGGLMTSQDGFTLELDQEQALAGPGRSIGFQITDSEGNAVTDYEVQHEKLLHLIVVRRDFTEFQHVHPTLSTDGEWSAQADLEPGQWRVFADFKPAGADALTLGADLAVPGESHPANLPAESRTSAVGDYVVTLDGDLVAGEHSMLTLSVAKDGKPVTDLEPYLGAYGHLVALREGDLAYLHVHPGGEPGDGDTQPGPEIEFGAEVPSGGGYHLYLDFKHDGVVRTAQFALEATGAPTGTDEDSHEHGH